MGTGSMQRKTKRQSYIAIWYVLFGTVWILFSDPAIQILFKEDKSILMINSIKGILFILLSGLFIHLMIRRERTIHRMMEEEAVLHQIINHLSNFVYIKDDKGRWLKANAQTEKDLNISPADYVGKTTDELKQLGRFPIIDVLEELDGMEDERVWKKGKPVTFEATGKILSSKERTLELMKIPIFHSQKKRAYMVVIGIDVTEKRLQESLIQKSEKLAVVGELAAGVAHEIRNPLTSLKGFLQLLEENHSPYSSIMLSEVNRISEIVNEFLLLAKPQSNRKIELNNMEQIIQETINLVSAQAIYKDVSIHRDWNAKVSHIPCDKNQMKQVLINIIHNAIESVEGGGEVTIYTSNNATDFFLIIKDTGAGIDKERLAKLGEPFFTTKEKGIGLGLMISNRIIESFGGTIFYKSELGVGTEVHITIPLNMQKKTG